MNDRLSRKDVIVLRAIVWMGLKEEQEREEPRQSVINDLKEVFTKLSVMDGYDKINNDDIRLVYLGDKPYFPYNGNWFSFHLFGEKQFLRFNGNMMWRDWWDFEYDLENDNQGFTINDFEDLEKEYRQCVEDGR